MQEPATLDRPTDDAVAGDGSTDTGSSDETKRDATLFCTEDYEVLKIVGILGAIELESTALDFKVGDELNLLVPNATVSAVQFRRDGTKRITFYAESFQPLAEKE